MKFMQFKSTQTPTFTRFVDIDNMMIDARNITWK